MRVAFFAKQHKRTGHTGQMERAMRSLGHDVLRIDRRRVERLVGRRAAWWWIQRRVVAFRPDLVLVFSFDLPADRMQELRSVAKTATFFDDCPRELSDRIRGAAAASDAFFITNRGQVPLYERETGVTAVYAVGGCDPTDHYRVPPVPEYVSDVAFIGKPNPSGGRIELMRSLAKHYDTRVYGPGWREVGIEPARDNVYPKQYRQICNSARVVIGIDLRADVDLYFSNRTWISLGCGAFLLTRYVPNLEEVLSEGEHCAFFRSPDDAVEQVARYLADPEARRRIADAGYRHAHEHYSYPRMLERMLSHPSVQPR